MNWIIIWYIDLVFQEVVQWKSTRGALQIWMMVSSGYIIKDGFMHIMFFLLLGDRNGKIYDTEIQIKDIAA